MFYKKLDFLLVLIAGFISAIFLYIIFTLQKFNLILGGIFIKNWQILIILPILSLIGFCIAIFLSKKYRIFYQIAKFILVGILNTSIDFGVLNILIFIFKIYGGLGIIVINSISFTLAVINSYLWNKYWTFESEKRIAGKEFFQFLFISIIGLLINDSIVYFLTTFIPPSGLNLAIWANIAKISATLIQLIWNFLGYKLIVFK